MGFVCGGGNIAIATALPPSFVYCIVRVLGKVRMLGKVLELLSANGGWFEINQLLFADDTALVTDSEEKLCRLVSSEEYRKKKVESECR